METILLVENPSNRGFTCLSGQLPSLPGRLEKAHCPRHLVVLAAVGSTGLLSAAGSLIGAPIASSGGITVHYVSIRLR
ncbi:hypothetical protein ACFV0C_28050 [Streptomyces sp. NPDC059568]|uniref:hypothetical protein n=1 Tax=Streptomyces sp. NPDC059568 TaxID=3346868 RepID=UPI0036B895E8